MPDLKPELLSQPNIPKPLHGLNPRTIMGKEQWDVLRQDVYASTNYHCKACGVHKSDAEKHQWLEAHEDFDIDYKNKTMTLRNIVPLCHYCHQFIHSGLLYRNFESGKLDREHVFNVLFHGQLVLLKNKFKIFPFTKQLSKEFGIDAGLEETSLPTSMEFSGWKMLWDGKEYSAKFQTQKEWEDFYDV